MEKFSLESTIPKLNTSSLYVIVLVRIVTNVIFSKKISCTGEARNSAFISL